MIFLRQGASAFSPFRIESLSRSIAGVLGSAPTRVEAAFAYVLSAPAGLGPDDLEKADALLGATGALDPAAPGFFVAPRKGTLSPWCSKATDIFRNCGLASVERVERAIRFQIDGADGRPLPPQDLAKIAGVLHDRMTQQIFPTAASLRALCDRAEPSPGHVFNVLGQGRAALQAGVRAVGVQFLRAGQRVFREDLQQKAPVFRGERGAVIVHG